ncbi:MAG: TetR family transcriptional regulator [Alphaproteobacteria bacterium]|nr:TetR family transcriptional regulator [Alphaproteobacteria bacterium]
MPRPRKTKAPPRDPRDAIIDAALILAARQGWNDTTLADIAAEAGVTLAHAHRHFGSKAAILGGFADRVDDAVLGGTGADLGTEPARDRLFDVLMRRFDALKPHKDAVRALAAAGAADPLALACGACRLARSMCWMLEAAGIATSGCRGRLRVKALTLGWATVLRTWLRDETEDHAPTMAALDRLLRRGETLEGWCAGFGRRAARGDAAVA